jgi:hypothetical protein
MLRAGEKSVPVALQVHGRLSLLKTLLDYVDANTTAMADASWDVITYTYPDWHQREEDISSGSDPW